MCNLIGKMVVVRQLIRDTRNWTSPFPARIICASCSGFLKLSLIEYPDFSIWVDMDNIDIMDVI
jgi:hypothetical protein